MPQFLEAAAVRLSFVWAFLISATADSCTTNSEIAKAL
ncbi:hypothetical protein C4K13_1633 [Pseudomonas chlororaphis subsp. aureofaciens]|nr:hypothetical protein C4K13_1633 [Pseudomonas chlororaphis subsp. aureofaciens]